MFYNFWIPSRIGVDKVKRVISSATQFLLVWWSGTILFSWLIIWVLLGRENICSSIISFLLRFLVQILRFSSAHLLRHCFWYFWWIPVIKLEILRQSLYAQAKFLSEEAYRTPRKHAWSIVRSISRGNQISFCYRASIYIYIYTCLYV